MQLVKQLDLPNGLTVNFCNNSHRYFGDYHRVRVEISCEIPILEEYFSCHEEFVEAKRALGDSVHFRRHVERMGVSTADLEASLESIIESFCGHSLTYLESPDFPRKLICRELASDRLKVQRSYPG